MPIVDDVAKIIIPLSGLCTGVLGFLMSRRGAKKTEREQDLADEFRTATAEKALAEEKRLAEAARTSGLTIVNDRLIAENDRLNTENSRIRAEWEGRWSRQMERCRKVTEPLVAALADLAASNPPTPSQRIRTDDAVRALQQHNDEDHTAT